jgi:hypothetical protein
MSRRRAGGAGTRRERWGPRRDRGQGTRDSRQGRKVERLACNFALARELRGPFPVPWSPLPASQSARGSPARDGYSRGKKWSRGESNPGPVTVSLARPRVSRVFLSRLFFHGFTPVGLRCPQARSLWSSSYRASLEDHAAFVRPRERSYARQTLWCILFYEACMLLDAQQPNVACPVESSSAPG